MSDLTEHVDAPGGVGAPIAGQSARPASRSGRVRAAPRDGSAASAGTSTTLDDPASAAAPDGRTAPNALAAHTNDQPEVTSAPAAHGEVTGRSRVFAVANQKGGVGKTTTAVNLGAALADLGHRVLIVDLDPQGNASTGLGIDPRNFDYSMYDVLLHDVPIDDCIEPTNIKNLFLAPSTLDLAGAEIELVPALSREHRLRRALEPVRNDFRYIFIDCPPSLGLITLNALTAASEVLVPIQCEFYALEGVSQLTRNVELVRSNLNPTLAVTTIVLTMYDARTKLSDSVVQEVRLHFGDMVCQNVIPRTVRISEAPSFGEPITVHDPTSRGAIAYRELAKEVSGVSS